MAALRYFFSLLMIPISLAGLAASIIALLAGYISPEQSSLTAFAGLGMPVILLINLVFAIYWAFRKKWWILVPVAAILINIGYLTSIFQLTLSSPSTNKAQTVFKIASYNVGGFLSWEKYSTQYSVTGYMRNDQVDILCLQEYVERNKMTADTLGKLLDFPYHAVCYLTNTKTSGSAIFSKYPIVDYQKIQIPSETNDAMWADIQIGKDTIRVFSCHLQTTNFYRKKRKLEKEQTGSNENFEKISNAIYGVGDELKKNFRLRAQQAEIVRKIIDKTKYPVIVCGDFNDTPASYTYHTIKGRLKDSFRSRGNGYGYTFRGIRKVLRIDFILYSSSLECISYESPDLSYSDHKPVIAEFSVKD